MSITLRNTPLFTRFGPVRIKRTAFITGIARAAEAERAKHGTIWQPDKGLEYWAGYRDALAGVIRLIEGSIDGTTDMALSNGLDSYNEWLALQE